MSQVSERECWDIFIFPIMPGYKFSFDVASGYTGYIKYQIALVGLISAIRLTLYVVIYSCNIANDLLQPLGEIIKRAGNTQPFVPVTPSTPGLNPLGVADPAILAAPATPESIALQQQQLYILQQQQMLAQQQQQQMALLRSVLSLSLC